MKTNFKPIILILLLSLPFIHLFAEYPAVIDQQNVSQVFKLELIFNGKEIFEEELNFDTRVTVNIFNVENKIEKQSSFDIREFIKPEKEVEEPEIDSMFNHRIFTSEIILTK